MVLLIVAAGLVFGISLLRKGSAPVLSIRSPAAGHLVAEGGRCFQVDDFEGAVTKYEEALRLSPRDPEILVRLGAAYRETGKKEKAAACFDRAAGLRPESSELLVKLAAYYREEGRLGDAEEQLRRATARAPAAHSVYLEWGRLYRKEKAGKKAEEALRRAIELDPGDIKGYIEIVLCRSQRGGGGSPPPPPSPFSRPASLPAAEKELPPHVILISIDTLRADRMSCYGQSRKTTPFIDGFAREAVFFENVISQSPHTAPSHMSVFTALMPDVHLVHNYGACETALALSPKIATLAEILRERGYRTVGFHAPPNLNAALGFGRGFDVYSASFNEREVVAGELPGGLAGSLDAKAGEGKPLFLFLHHLYCHSPYVFGLPSFRKHFLTSPVPGLPTSPSDLDPQDPHGSFWAKVDLSRPADREHVLALYDGGVYYSDFLFQKMIELLKQAGCYEDALIVLFSDHGEEFYEHGGKEHEHLFIEQLRVPLMIKFPRGEYGGRRVAKTVRLIDLMPTLLEYLGISPPPRIQGTSFLSLVEGGGGYAPPIVSFSTRLTGVRVVKEDLAYSDELIAAVTEWLFDEKGDPREERNLAGFRPDLLAPLRELAAELKRAKQGYLDLMLGTRPLARTEVDGETRARLKSLGYVK